MMSLTQRFCTILLGSTLIWFTGCVGPKACGPCGSNGPLAFGGSCDGCGECGGCGELYIDPWVNHPADACDPCDKCGNYNGQSCGKCRSVFDGFASLWGYRCDGGCDTGCEPCGTSSCGGGGALTSCGSSCGGCDSCCSDSCGGCDSCGGHDLVHIDNAPSVGHDIVEAVEPYQPQRTRKIFNPRSPAPHKPHSVATRHPADSGRAITITR